MDCAQHMAYVRACCKVSNTKLGACALLGRLGHKRMQKQPLPAADAAAGAVDSQAAAAVVYHCSTAATLAAGPKATPPGTSALA